MWMNACFLGVQKATVDKLSLLGGKKGTYT